MLRVENIDVSYGDLQILWDVSFEVNEGEIVALVGANVDPKVEGRGALLVEGWMHAASLRRL